MSGNIDFEYGTYLSPQNIEQEKFAAMHIIDQLQTII